MKELRQTDESTLMLFSGAALVTAGFAAAGYVSGTIAANVEAPYFEEVRRAQRANTPVQNALRGALMGSLVGWISGKPSIDVTVAGAAFNSAFCKALRDQEQPQTMFQRARARMGF